MPKNEQKTLNFRIFRQLPAKLSLQSQYLCGFWGGTVEMKEARLGRWHISRRQHIHHLQTGRNERSPFRALTHYSYVFSHVVSSVEMKEARLGRWHRMYLFRLYYREDVEMKEARLGRWHTSHNAAIIFRSQCRNERSPFRALTHFSRS